MAKAALGYAPSERHLAAFKAGHPRKARAGSLSLHAACGLGPVTTSNSAPDNLAAVFGPRRGSEFVKTHACLPCPCCAASSLVLLSVNLSALPSSRKPHCTDWKTPKTSSKYP